MKTRWRIDKQVGKVCKVHGIYPCYNCQVEDLKAELAEKDAIINGLITGQSNALAELAKLRALCGVVADWFFNRSPGFQMRANPTLFMQLKDAAGRGEESK